MHIRNIIIILDDNMIWGDYSCSIQKLSSKLVYSFLNCPWQGIQFKMNIYMLKMIHQSIKIIRFIEPILDENHSSGIRCTYIILVVKILTWYLVKKYPLLARLVN